MRGDIRYRLSRHGLRPVILTMAVTLCSVIPAAGQYPTASFAANPASALTGSVPSDQPSNKVLSLTLGDAITRALRYNLATIESGESARIARAERLLALSRLVPEVSAGASENVQ